MLKEFVIRKCVICNRNFSTKHTRKKTCSFECHHILLRWIGHSKAKFYGLKICAICGDSFSPIRIVQKTCSKECSEIFTHWHNRTLRVKKMGASMKKFCVICNKEIISDNRRRKTCSFGCNEILSQWSLHSRRRSKKCVICETDFLTNYKIKTCSKNCLRILQRWINYSRGRTRKISNCIVCGSLFRGYNKTCSMTCARNSMKKNERKTKNSSIYRKNKNFKIDTSRCIICNELIRKYKPDGRRFITKTCSKKCYRIRMAEVLKGRKCPKKKYGKCFIYNGVSYRSGWEIEVAKYFDRHNIKFIYEGFYFDLGDGIFYNPDFYLPDLRIFIEVKGFWFLRDIEKRERFWLYCRSRNLQYGIIDKYNYSMILNDTWTVEHGIENITHEQERYIGYMVGMEI